MVATVKIMTPLGRVTNSSFWEKDVFKNDRGQEAKPAYKLEMVLENDDALAEFEQSIVAAAVAEWGAGAEDDYWDGKIRSPLQDGTEYAADRIRRGKKGDAYEGKIILRASTIYNRNGEDAPGGIYVCGADAAELDFTDRSKVYNGCFGVASVTPHAYKVQDRGVTLYLNGFQFQKDGERLRGSDPSSLFSPMMGAASEGKGRRGRGK